MKLIATDVDGTLVQDSATEVYDELIGEIQRLVDSGIKFVVASGRQYASIRKMFRRTDRNLIYIAENGAHIVVDDKTFSVTGMKREYAEGILTDMREFYPQGCHVVASTKNGCLLESKDDSFIDLIKNGYRNEMRLTENILEEDEEIIKIAIYKKESIREIGESILIPKWNGKVKACMAGNEWVDFMDASVDKGNALKKVQNHFGINKEETMAFGDNNNDVGLLRAAGESYAVATAVPDVKAVAKYICPSYKEKGVYQILSQLLTNNE